MWCGMSAGSTRTRFSPHETPILTVKGSGVARAKCRSTSQGTRLAARLLVLTAVLLSAARLPLGFSAGDEGLYIGTAARYASGDRPVSDERLNPASYADVLASPLYRLWPHLGVLDARAAGLAACVLVAVAIHAAFTGIIPTTLLHALTAAFICFQPFNLWPPNYKSASLLLLALAIAAGTLAVRTQRACFRFGGFIGSGVLFGLACACYIPFVLLAVVPAVVLLGSRRDASLRAAGVRGGVVVWLTVVGAMVGGAAVWLVTTELGLQAQENFAALAARATHRLDPAHKLWAKASSFRHWPLAVGTALWFGAAACLRGVESSAGRKAGSLAAVAGLLGLGAGFVVAPPAYATHSPQLLLFNLGLLVLAVVSLAVVPSQPRRHLWAAGALLGTGWCAGGIMVASSSAIHNPIEELNVCSWLLWLGAAYALGLTLPSGDGRGRGAWGSGRTLELGLGLCLFAVSVAHLWRWSYEDDRPWRLRAAFSHTRLRGVYSTAARVQQTEALLDCVRTVAAQGSYVLAYSFPALPFLTETRPAFFSTWVTYGVPGAAHQRLWVREMAEAGRLPRVVVAPHELEARDPLSEMVVDRYRLSEECGGYVIYVRDSASRRAAPPGCHNDRGVRKDLQPPNRSRPTSTPNVP